MADEEQLAVLQQGPRASIAWNRWREQNRGRHPNLASADLSEINLSGANLRGADLARADLCCADLSRADLLGASLSGANLSGADLVGADLVNCNLSDANLTGAFLDGADFTMSYLDGVNLYGAQLFDTAFVDIDLSGTKGLEACRHRGPSIIDVRTLQLSGQLPLSFLRGCGLPDNLIDYLPSLFNQPIQFYSCFISYSSKDDDFAHRLHADLQDKGIRCWFAPEDMKIGDRIRTRIDEVIRLHEKLLLVLSANSINSDWVEKEVETAFEKERETKSIVLFPVRLDEAVMESRTGWAADIKRSRHIGDFIRWKDHDGYRKAFERLLRDLKVELTT
jgi:TIR domain/Pentapeptide repeats (8 copies)